MKIVIFGNRVFASLAWYCITHDSEDEVAAFTVDAPFLAAPTHHDLPVVDFAGVESRFPPDEYSMLVHGGGLEINTLRTQRFEAPRMERVRDRVRCDGEPEQCQHAGSRAKRHRSRASLQADFE